MKLVTYLDDLDSSERLGVLVEDDRMIVDVQAAHMRRDGQAAPAYSSMQHLIEAGQEALDGVRAIEADHDAADCIAVRGAGQLLSPLPRPIQMRDCLCFEEHLTNAMDGRNRVMGRTERTPEQTRRLELFRSRPFWYKCNRFAFVGPDAVVRWPSYSTWMDFELELGMVIGRTARNISVENAHEHIFGFTIFNDFSARDVQNDEMASLGPCRSKDFDTGNVLGPCIVTADAFNLADARMEARVNGERWGGGSTATMNYSFHELIAFISAGETLHAGELLGSGTVGTGCGLELGRQLESGDVVELEIEGIGVLRNQVVAG
jgi:2-keto-4-pentenoate hydratase/2-oxohepta-3-ene-1,7-dioic acid hydratase in catechol pathway